MDAAVDLFYRKVLADPGINHFFVYPLTWLFSRLDFLVPFGRGYAVVVESVRPAEE